MSTLPTRRRPEPGASRRSPMAAAARAAAKRSDRLEDEDDLDGLFPAQQTDEPEPAGTENGFADGTEETPARGRGILLPTALLVLLVALLATVTVLGLRYHDAERTAKARVAALAAAHRSVPVILSYDYRHLDQDFTAATGMLTGSFRDQYAKTTESVVKPTALQYQAVVQATVADPTGGGGDAASVVSASPDRVVVLVYVNQVTTSSRVSGPHLDLNRVRLTLEHTSAGWKVSAVDAL